MGNTREKQIESPVSGQIDQTSEAPDRRLFRYALLTWIASLMGIISDLILGWSKPGNIGPGGIIQVGWADYALWRPGVSMLLASVAFPFYLLGMVVLFEKTRDAFPRLARILRVTGFASACGWLLTHAFFCCPQYVFAYLSQRGAPTVAANLAGELLWMLLPSLLIFLLLKAVTLLLFAGAILSGKTRYPRPVALLSPIPVAAILSTLRLIFPSSAFVLGLTAASVHIGMFLLFGYIVLHEKIKSRSNSNDIKQSGE
jgi:hypothetical protein